MALEKSLENCEDLLDWYSGASPWGSAILPPNQAEMMVSALREKGVPVAYILFEGEQHGFRKAENTKRALDAELHFYSRIFGFRLPDPVEPVQIENLG